MQLNAGSVGKIQVFHVWRGRVNARNIALAGFVAAAYAVLVITLPMISFLLFQVRVADALLMLSTAMGWPAIVGVTLGCFIGNVLAAPWGSALLAAIDAVLGSAANFVASYLAYRIAWRKGVRHMVAAAAAETLVVSVIVGAYLKYLLEWAFNLEVPVWLSIAGVIPGSVISIVLLGLPLSMLVSKHLSSERGKNRNV
ncbi:MAG: QueT transporter family protein [Thermofilaceae archaeon]